MNRSSIANAIRSASLRTQLAALTLLAPVASFAQEAADPFDAAVTTITAKITSYGGALVGVAAVGVVFYVAIKFVKKLPRAA